MKRRLARSPRARMIAGKAASPARVSAGGGTIFVGQHPAPDFGNGTSTPLGHTGTT
jgi:hypothetical protein